MRLPVALLLVPAITLAACSGGAPEKEGARENAVETSANLTPRADKVNDAAVLANAFRAAFKAPEVRLGDDIYSFRPAALYRMDDRWVLLSEGSGPDCHACSGFLAAHYLAGEPGAFSVTGGRADAIPGSSFGAPPEWRMRTDLMAAPVIEAHGGGTWQGISCSTATLTELAPEGPALRAKDIPLLYDDTGAIVDDRAPTSVKGTVGEGQRSRNFIVRYDGSVKREIAYDRKGDLYAPAAKTDDVPQC